MVRYTLTGEIGEVIPLDATHFSAHASVTVIRSWTFCQHANIVEFICHAGVKRIEEKAFYRCPCLERVVIPGVEVIERDAFTGCEAVMFVECKKLERIEACAFYGCKSLSGINLRSVRHVGNYAFSGCPALTDAIFGIDLESIKFEAFDCCTSLERITIPLKDGLITYDNTFKRCDNLKHVDLVGGEVLHETIAALHLEEWRNDMQKEFDSINHVLANTGAGSIIDEGGKARAIRGWILRVLQKIINYKAEHCQLLSSAATSLQLALPDDLSLNNVLPFLELPLHTFDGEEEEEESNSRSNDDSDESSNTSEEDNFERNRGYDYDDLRLGDDDFDYDDFLETMRPLHLQRRMVIARRRGRGR